MRSLLAIRRFALNSGGHGGRYLDLLFSVWDGPGHLNERSDDLRSNLFYEFCWPNCSEPPDDLALAGNTGRPAFGRISGRTVWVVDLGASAGSLAALRHRPRRVGSSRVAQEEGRRGLIGPGTLAGALFSANESAWRISSARVIGN